MTVMAGRRRPVVLVIAVAVGLFALLFAYDYAHAGGQSAGGQSSAAGGPGCPPLPSASADIYPYSTAAGADKIRVSPPDDSGGVDGETDTFTITACYGPVNWSVSAPSYVTVHPKSGTLRTGQQVRVQASYVDPGVNTNLTVNPGDYVLGSSYNVG
jgi:hypothetical protein